MEGLQRVRASIALCNIPPEKSMGLTVSYEMHLITTSLSETDASEIRCVASAVCVAGI